MINQTSSDRHPEARSGRRKGPGIAATAIVGCALLVLGSMANAFPITLYDFPIPGSGQDFDIPANDSSDTDPESTASRLASMGVDGGGANDIINETDGRFTGVSNSGPPVTNWGNGGGVDLGSYVFFQITPNPGVTVRYESISLFHHSFDGSGMFSLRYLDGGGALQDVALGISNPDMNSPAGFSMLDFPDFESSNLTEWRIYLFGASNNNTGFRFDDITLNATTVPEPATSTLFLFSLVAVGVMTRRRSA